MQGRLCVFEDFIRGSQCPIKDSIRGSLCPFKGFIQGSQCPFKGSIRGSLCPVKDTIRGNLCPFKGSIRGNLCPFKGSIQASLCPLKGFLYGVVLVVCPLLDFVQPTSFKFGDLWAQVFCMLPWVQICFLTVVGKCFGAPSMRVADQLISHVVIGKCALHLAEQADCFQWSLLSVHGASVNKLCWMC